MPKSGWLTGRFRTPKKAGWLTREKIPSFMKICGHYEVVIGPTISRTAPFDLDHIYLYGVRDIHDKGIVFYFESPFENLPHEFWVRMVTAAYSYFEFVSCDDWEAMEQHHPRVRGLVIPKVIDVLSAHKFA